MRPQGNAPDGLVDIRHARSGDDEAVDLTANCCRRRSAATIHRTLQYSRYSIKSLILLAPRAGFEPATNRLTAGCSTTELPGNIAINACDVRL